MPVKNKQANKAAASKAEISKAKVSTAAAPSNSTRSMSGTSDKAKAVGKAAAQARSTQPKASAAVKPTTGKAPSIAKSNAAKNAPPAAAAIVKSAGALRSAAVSAQKNDTTKTPLQPRTLMASSTASKIAPQSKAAAPQLKAAAKAAAKPASMPASIKVPAGKAPLVKPAAPVKAASVKAEATPVVQIVAARAPQARPAAARAMPAAVSGAATAQRISAPAAPIAAAAIATPKDIALKAQQAAAATPKKPVNTRHGFKINELVVYPAHGVGRIVAIEEQEIAGMALELFVITFEKDKMTLRVPTGRSQSVMRKLAEDGVVKRAMDTLKGKARIKRTMWSRRAQEFEQKINSGDLVSIAEVVRDLFRAETQPEQSYSERQLYEAALDRMAREIAAVEKIDERGAVQRVTEVLSKSAKSRRAESDAATAAGDIKAA
jgi:CarD family transcriptional regulator